MGTVDPLLAPIPGAERRTIGGAPAWVRRAFVWLDLGLEAAGKV